MPEWLVIDKIDDFLYFDKVIDICNYFNLSKSQIDNVFQQSLKHYNKYTKRDLYIQRLFNENTRPPRSQYNQDKYIYYEDQEGNKEYGVIFDKNKYIHNI
tara:strand:- start:1669 stop:1968 length:300 start_codon:yes stop_codon:yes gene_type:complete